MESSIPSTNKTEPSHPGTASNLDSFFKRLGQGQGSRLWTGPGRAGAVPGSLRTHLNPRSDDGINKPALAVPGSATAGTGRAGRIPPGSERRPAATAADINNETTRTAAAVDAGATAGGSKGNERKHLEKGAERGSLSSLVSSGSRGELEGGGNTSRMGSFVGRAGGVLGSAFASDAGGASGIGSRRGSRGSNGTAFGDPEVDDDLIMSSPVSPSPAPPSLPKSLSQLAQLAQPPGTATAGVATPRKPVPKPAAKPTSKPAAPTPPSPPLTNRPSYRDKRFEEVLGEEIVRLDELRKISWNGVPQVHRAAVWQLLVGYMPANKSRRAAAMERKRREYWEAVPQYFNVPDAARSHQEQNILRQILVDVPRTCPDVPFFHQEKVQRAMERILYIWAIRHPASGYVQGINDIMTPLYVVFLSAHVGPSVESKDVGKVDQALLDEVEADVYWCLTKLLDNIQDHYTAMQPGLQRMVLRLEELVQRIDAELHEHMMEQGMLYIQFAFRWMNCLLMRELPQRAVVRAWDTYLAEENGFESFHVYVSAALLCHFSSTLREMDFQAMVMFLQDMPTKEWGEEEVEPLLSQAYILSTLFEGSPNHLGA